MNRVETSKGVLKYRNPTIIETIALVKILREFFATEDLVGAKLKVMENIKDLLDYSEMNDIKNFDDLNSFGEEMTGVLYDISGVIFNKVVGAFAKKD
jgi:hypothetical protein